MGMQMCVRHPLRVGLVLALALAGAGGTSYAAAAPAVEPDLDSNRVTFAAQSYASDPLAIPPEDGATRWSSAEFLAADSARYDGSDIYRSTGDHSFYDTNHGESFSDGSREHHHGSGGEGEGEHGGYGDDHGGRCDDGCIGATAVPEPKSGLLMVAGAAALLLVIRRRRGAAGLFAAR